MVNLEEIQVFHHGQENNHSIPVIQCRPLKTQNLGRRCSESWMAWRPEICLSSPKCKTTNPGKILVKVKLSPWNRDWQQNHWEGSSPYRGFCGMWPQGKQSPMSWGISRWLPENSHYNLCNKWNWGETARKITMYGLRAPETIINECLNAGVLSTIRKGYTHLKYL